VILLLVRGVTHPLDDEEEERQMDISAVHEALLSRLGRFPERVTLEPVVGNASDEGEYTRTLITYRVEAGERVPAWLLIPRGPVPGGGWPAVLAIHQHGGQFDKGKSEIVGLIDGMEYPYGRDLCLRGYVVLCPDLLCFEERRPAPPSPWAGLEGGNYERFEFTRRVIEGSSLQTKYLHDLSCSLDLLASLPDVDATRMGVIGHSLGGQETLWLAWYDPRVAAAVSSCGFSLMRALVRDGINHNYAAYLPGMLEICDIDALVCSLAPRPFLLAAGETDPIFPIDGVRAIVERARQVYEQQGVPERFQTALVPTGHQFSEELKTRSYAFLDRWLKG
jgi:dienelactone hydrolase